MFKEKTETNYTEVYIIENGKKATLFTIFKDEEREFSVFFNVFGNFKMAEILECNELLFKEFVENNIDKERFSLSDIKEEITENGGYFHVIEILDKNGEVKAKAYGVPVSKNKPTLANLKEK